MITTATTGAISPNPVATEAVRIAVEEPWRLEPHRLAEHASGGRWQAYRHHRLISQRIARAIGRGGGRIIICLPPGHGKSSLASLWTPIWFLNNFPAERVIMTSHSDELATDWGRKVRNEFDGNPLLSTRLSPDSSAAARWNTPEGGGMLAAGVGTGITGFRCNLGLVDDPHPTWESAVSLTQRTRVRDWFNGTLYDRLEPNATLVILAHRWHEDDLPGYLISEHSDPWEVISFPALAEAGDPLGRAEGEALWPERFDAKALHGIRSAVGKLVWNAKYQQKPMGVGAGRVYDRYEPTAHEDKTLTLRDDLPLDLSFDFNRNPGMHIEVGQYDKRADLFTAVHEIFGPLMKLNVALVAAKELIDGLIGEDKAFRWPLLRIFGDATGTQQRAETTETAYQQIKSWLKASQWPCQIYVPAANPPVRDRIDTFNEALRDVDGAVHYKVHPINCPRLVTDLKYLKADEQGLIDKRDLKLSHPSDAEGYRLHQLRPLLKSVEVGKVRVSGVIVV